MIESIELANIIFNMVFLSIWAVIIVLYFKMFHHLKKTKNPILKKITYQSKFLSFLPESYRVNLGFIEFMLSIKGEKDKTLKKYKIWFVVWFVVEIILLIGGPELLL